jgi:hypothetical protein
MLEPSGKKGVFSASFVEVSEQSFLKGVLLGRVFLLLLVVKSIAQWQ